jgi:hypothetical protein
MCLIVLISIYYKLPNEPKEQYQEIPVCSQIINKKSIDNEGKQEFYFLTNTSMKQVEYSDYCHYNILDTFCYTDFIKL